jgi:CheY-like chemotaxis protein
MQGIRWVGFAEKFWVLDNGNIIAISKMLEKYYNKTMDKQSGYLLVVEDIPNILDLIDATLKFKGYRVATARNGEEALEAIQRERPAIVITDILMPKMDGFSLVHRLRLDPETRNIPVVFLSATYVAPEDKTFAVLIGVSRFLEKPIDIDQLMRTITELLAQEVPAVSEPLKEFEFYDGYRKRIKIKLDQKIKQIARIERLLPTVSEEEKPAFLSSLHLAMNERDELRLHLDQVNERIESNAKSEEKL